MAVKMRTARKAHVCEQCNKPICAGSRYLDERDPNYKGRAFRWHPGCRQVAVEEAEDDAAEHDWGYGALALNWIGPESENPYT